MSAFTFAPFLQEARRIQHAWYQQVQAAEHNPHLTAQDKAEQLVRAELERQRCVTALQQRAQAIVRTAQHVAWQRLHDPATAHSLATVGAAAREVFELERYEAYLEQLDQKTYLMSLVDVSTRRMEDVPGWTGSEADDIAQRVHALSQAPM